MISSTLYQDVLSNPKNKYVVSLYYLFKPKIKVLNKFRIWNGSVIGTEIRTFFVATTSWDSAGELYWFWGKSDLGFKCPT